jgi:periplasmic protein TonB
MIKGWALKALVAALAIHGAILLFGGLVLFHGPKKAVVRENVELVAEEAKQKPAEPPKAEEKKAEQAPIEESSEPMPDVKNLAQLESPVAAPALAALSLADLEGVLSDAGGSGGFGTGGNALSSGGRIGGTGAPGGPVADLSEIASLADLDQKPRAIFQSAPSYPVELRKRNLEGSVQVVFLVDTEGRVVSPKVEKSTNPSFDRPALEAVRQWRFEAGTRNGERVAFKMRVPITFSAS